MPNILICTFSAVKPNNMEKQKVKLAFSVISWPVRNALIFYAETLPTKFPATKVYPTVEFMDAARDFFDILNINHVKKGPIRSMASKKIQRLTEVLAYFESLSTTGILSAETRSALLQTVSFLVSSSSSKLEQELVQHYQANTLVNNTQLEILKLLREISQEMK